MIVKASSNSNREATVVEAVEGRGEDLVDSLLGIKTLLTSAKKTYLSGGHTLQ
jgi:hypothetical protein